MGTETADRARRIAAARAAATADHDRRCRASAATAHNLGHQEAVAAEAGASAELAHWALAQRRAAEARDARTAG